MYLKLFGTIGVLILTLGLATVAAVGLPSRHRAVDSRFYCVLLANGQVYFGHLSGLESPYPELVDVYYVSSEPTGKDGETRNVLLKRGASEWHQPEKMLLNRTQIVLVEPVNPASVVAQRIRELNARTTNAEHPTIHP